MRAGCQDYTPSEVDEMETWWMEEWGLLGEVLFLLRMP